MQRQHEIVTGGALLNKDGSLAQKGYSTRALLQYNREAIKAPPWRIKEWDFYQVSNDRCCLQMTIGHVSYAGAVTATLFELDTGLKHEISAMLALPFNRLRMPRSAEEGDLLFESKNMFMSFEAGGDRRILTCRAGGKKGCSMDIAVTLFAPDKTSVVMATPFDEDRRYFYYNHKINCMPAEGTAVINGRKYIFSPDSSFGLLDWGRGVWPFRHSWYWGSGSCWLDGKRFGFNIGWGFGNTAAATENILFYDGTAHKLGRVHANLQEGGYMSTKRFTSDGDRFNLEFTPLHDNYTETRLLFVDNRCHQLFGKFNGTVILDDGSKLQVKDMTAFIEHAVNNW